MFGILWTKGEETKLTRAGSEYATIYIYLSEFVGDDPFFLSGWTPEIVSVHREDGRWVC